MALENAKDATKKLAATAWGLAIDARGRLTAGPLTAAKPAEDVLPSHGRDDAAAAEALRHHNPLAPASEHLVGMAIDPDAVVLGALIMAGTIASLVAEEETGRRMARIVASKREDLHDTLGLSDVGPAGTLEMLTSKWTRSERTLLLIELALVDPFAPHENTWSTAERNRGLAYVAEVVGATVETAADVLATFSDALRAHKRVSLRRIGLYSVAAAIAVGGAGFLAAPMLGAALGSATGLSGAAATSHGLALIGGLGSSGSTMAAGTWLIAQTGLTMGGVSGAIASTLYQMGASQAQAELVKLQVAAKMILVDLQRNDAAAHGVAVELGNRLDELEQRIETELLFSDAKSDRIAELRTTADAVRDAQAWIDHHCHDDDGGITVTITDLRSDIDALAAGEAATVASAVVAADVERRIVARFERTVDLDRSDVIAAISAGLVGAVIDGFLTATPAASPVTRTLRSLASGSDNWLSRNAKVPFDQSIGAGFTPHNHRTLTPGHDPLIGLVWGTFDIIGSTMTYAQPSQGLRTVSYAGSVQGAPGLLAVLTKELAHLASDIVTPAGLPLPGWSAFVISENLSEDAVRMYSSGYDTWHLPAMAVPAAATTVVTRLYWNTRRRHDSEFAAITSEAPDDPRYKMIRLIADGVACAGDVATLLMCSGNPLAVNWAQWLTVARRIATHMADGTSDVTTTLLDDLQRNQRWLNQSWADLADSPAI